MYVGRKFTATAKAVGERDFVCASCGFKARARVVGVGQGAGNSPYFLDEQGAKDRAHRSAGHEAEKNIDETLGLCPCPECGHRSGAGAFQLRAAGVIVGTALFLWGIGALLAMLKGRVDGAMLLIFGSMGFVMPPVIYFYGMHWRWTTAALRVEFLESKRGE
jgi:hypothetical protein